jgi:Tol biopolymer transport system component
MLKYIPRTTTVVLSLLIAGIVFGHSQADQEVSDRLIIRVTPYDYQTQPSQLIVYDPQQTPALTMLISDITFRSFIVSREGLIAVSMNYEVEQTALIALINLHAAEPVPITIQTWQGVSAYPLAWSPDGARLQYIVEDGGGHYEMYVWENETNTLLTRDFVPVFSGRFEASEDWNQDGSLIFSTPDQSGHLRLQVWNGETTTDITPTDLPAAVERYVASWSVDEQVAFAANFGLRGSAIPVDLYLWDGETTRNLTEALGAGDYDYSAPVWSADGRLMFAANTPHRADVVTWAGGNGRSIETGLMAHVSSLGWTADGRAFFSATKAGETFYQVYVFDGTFLHNISENAFVDTFAVPSLVDGRLALYTWSADRISVHDAQNHVLLDTEGQFRPAWSMDGALVFCRRAEIGWSLMLWDGYSVWEVASGSRVNAQWESGERVACVPPY